MVRCTAKADKLAGSKGENEIRGVGARDDLIGGLGRGTIYGGDRNDFMGAFQDGQPDKLYCGKGQDEHLVEEKIDYVSSSCEKQMQFKGIP